MDRIINSYGNHVRSGQDSNMHAITGEEYIWNDYSNRRALSEQSEYDLWNLPPNTDMSDIKLQARTEPSMDHSIFAVLRCKDCETLFTR